MLPATSRRPSQHLLSLLQDNVVVVFIPLKLKGKRGWGSSQTLYYRRNTAPAPKASAGEMWDRAKGLAGAQHHEGRKYASAAVQAITK